MSAIHNASIPNRLPLPVVKTEHKSCCITNIALPIIAALAGFVFLPAQAAMGLACVIMLGTLLCNGCINDESAQKASEWMSNWGNHEPTDYRPSGSSVGPTPLPQSAVSSFPRHGSVVVPEREEVNASADSSHFSPPKPSHRPTPLPQSGMSGFPRHGSVVAPEHEKVNASEGFLFSHLKQTQLGDTIKDPQRIPVPGAGRAEREEVGS